MSVMPYVEPRCSESPVEPTVQLIIEKSVELTNERNGDRHPERREQAAMILPTESPRTV